ncbi:hypothetical protein CSAL01_03914 [Colletotrichum salicis]|uniref:Uncharacterized protein n=1 Tax=Colletotrichum salicis TaxID=1209931 RepID=A0A135URC1_9PEZI|nr:hypothetical protein CSAL01_03914 [Colletotrichum salicis]
MVESDEVVAGSEEELDKSVEDDVNDDEKIELLVDDVSEVESEVSRSNIELEDVEEVIELDIESDELEEVASGALEEEEANDEDVSDRELGSPAVLVVETAEMTDDSDEVEGVTPGAAEEVDSNEDASEEVLVLLADDDSDVMTWVAIPLVVLEDAEVDKIEDEGKVELEMVVVDSAVELAEDVVKLEKDDSELAIKLAGSIIGLEERDSPVELDEEESDELAVASAELSELDTDDELRSEFNEEREEVAPVVGDSVDVEARLAGSIVGEADGELLVDVVTEDETDVTGVASSELDWGAVEVDSVVEVLVSDGMEDPVKVAAELDDDRESLSEVLEVVELENVLAEEDVGMIEIPSELVSKLTEVGSVIETLVVTEEEEPVELEEERGTLSEVLETLSVKVLCDVESRLSGLIVGLGEEKVVLEISNEVELEVALMDFEVARLRLDEEPEEISEASEVVEESTIKDDLIESELSLLEILEGSTVDEDVVLVMDDNASDAIVELDAEGAPDELLESKDEELVSVLAVVDSEDVESSIGLEVDCELGSEVALLDTEELSDEDTELVVVESLDVDSKVLISTVLRVLVDEDELLEEIDVDRGLGSEVETLDTGELPLVEVPLDVGSNVSGSIVVAVVEDSDEEPDEELVEVSSTESLIDVTVVAELRVSVADGVCGSLLVVELEPDEDVGVKVVESLDEITEALLSTPDDEMLDVGDSVSRPIVSEELVDSKDDEVIGVEVDSVIKVLETADSTLNEVLVDDCWPSELVIDKVVVAAESFKSLDEDDVAPERSLLEVVGSSVVDSDVELGSNVLGLTVILTLEDVEDSVEAASDEEIADRSELLDDEEDNSASKEIDETEMTE